MRCTSRVPDAAEIAALALFFFTGVGNASTFQMIPVIMGKEVPRLMPQLTGADRARQIAQIAPPPRPDQSTRDTLPPLCAHTRHGIAHRSGGLALEISQPNSKT